MSDGDRRNYIVNSVDRIYEFGDDPTRFKVNLTPNLSNLRTIRLENATFPFNWNNVVPEYGNSLHIIYTSGVAGVLDFYVTIPTGFYTTTQLLAYINTAVQNFFSTQPLVVSPFLLVENTVTTRIELNYDSSVWGTGIVDFDLSWAPIRSTSFHVYRMLGLSTTDQALNTFTFAVSGFQSFPLTFANNLPISYILINIEEIPSHVLTTGHKAGTFYVSVSDAVINGERVQAPISFKRDQDYFNDINLPEFAFNMKELNVTLTDSRGYSLLNQGPKEWSMTFSYTNKYSVNKVY